MKVNLLERGPSGTPSLHIITKNTQNSFTFSFIPFIFVPGDMAV